MVFTLQDLIAGMRDEIATRAEVYGRRVSFGQMTQERANERLAFFAAILAQLEADHAYRCDSDRHILPPSPPKPERVPASQSQQIALRAQIAILKDHGIEYDEIQARMSKLTGCETRQELDSATAAKLVSAFENWVVELQGERARLDGRMAEQPEGVPF